MSLSRCVQRVINVINHSFQIQSRSRSVERNTRSIETDLMFELRAFISSHSCSHSGTQTSNAITQSIMTVM